MTPCICLRLCLWNFSRYSNSILFGNNTSSPYTMRGTTILTKYENFDCFLPHLHYGNQHPSGSRQSYNLKLLFLQCWLSPDMSHLIPKCTVLLSEVTFWPANSKSVVSILFAGQYIRQLLFDGCIPYLSLSALFPTSQIITYIVGFFLARTARSSATVMWGILIDPSLTSE